MWTRQQLGKKREGKKNGVCCGRLLMKGKRNNGKGKEKVNYCLGTNCVSERKEIKKRKGKECSVFGV